MKDKLDGFHAFHVASAELLRADGRSGEANAAYGKALELARNSAEKAHLVRRQRELALPPPPASPANQRMENSSEQ